MPIKIGTYKEIESIYDLNSDFLIKRLINKRNAYLKKYKNKSLQEIEYYSHKGIVGEI